MYQPTRAEVKAAEVCPSQWHTVGERWSQVLDNGMLENRMSRVQSSHFDNQRMKKKLKSLLQAKKKFTDPDMIWTRNLLIWSQTRYHCATESTDYTQLKLVHLKSGCLFVNFQNLVVQPKVFNSKITGMYQINLVSWILEFIRFICTIYQAAHNIAQLKCT